MNRVWRKLRLGRGLVFDNHDDGKNIWRVTGFKSISNRYVKVTSGYLFPTILFKGGETYPEAQDYSYGRRR